MEKMGWATHIFCSSTLLMEAQTQEWRRIWHQNQLFICVSCVVWMLKIQFHLPTTTVSRFLCLYSNYQLCNTKKLLLCLTWNAARYSRRSEKNISLGLLSLQVVMYEKGNEFVFTVCLVGVVWRKESTHLVDCFHVVAVQSSEWKKFLILVWFDLFLHYEWEDEFL